MLKSLWQKIKVPFVWIADKWHKFELWLASIAPGVKTKMIAGASTVASLASALQEFITGIPLGQIVSAEKVVIITTVLFALTFWLRRLSDKDTA